MIFFIGFIFNRHHFVFQRLIWKMISVYFLWFDYWTLKEWKTAKVQNHSVLFRSRSILAIYTNDWSTFWYVYCCYLIFFWGGGGVGVGGGWVGFLNVCKPRTTTSPLTAWPTWIGILWKWASMFTNLAGDGECTPALFHVIRNFLANEICHFSRLSHQTTFYLGI